MKLASFQHLALLLRKSLKCKLILNRKFYVDEDELTKVFQTPILSKYIFSATTSVKITMDYV